MSFLDRWPSLLRALLAQALALLLVLGAAALIAPWRPIPLWIALGTQSILAAILTGLLGLGAVWIAFQALAPMAALWQMGHRVPFWVYPAMILGLLLVFGGGLRTRVPLYHSSRAAWRALAELVPAGATAVADLGAGFGGPMVHLARQRPELETVGVEASPLVWMVARIRALPVRQRCRIRYGSLWDLDLAPFQVVYAFLSPVPMPSLWEKARREMAPGSLLVSNTFEIPGAAPERVIPLPGRRDACLRLYRIP